MVFLFLQKIFLFFADNFPFLLPAVFYHDSRTGDCGVSGIHRTYLRIFQQQGLLAMRIEGDYRLKVIGFPGD